MAYNKDAELSTHANTAACAVKLIGDLSDATLHATVHDNMSRAYDDRAISSSRIVHYSILLSDATIDGRTINSANQRMNQHQQP
jgi:hypothetical protein